MNWDNWSLIEAALLRLDIRPILAVVPNNQDPQLKVRPARVDFWDRVRFWQSRGWTIALHGYEHLYVTNQAGLIPLNHRSEFAGLSPADQEMKLRSGLKVFASEKVTPTVWIAPSHSFDAVTVSLLASLGIKIISDGFAYRPFRDRAGMTWVPQQLWDLGDVRSGIWTVCYHCNAWTPNQLQTTIDQFATYRDRITSLDSVLAGDIRLGRSVIDCLFWRYGPAGRVSPSALIRSMSNIVFSTTASQLRRAMRL